MKLEFKINYIEIYEINLKRGDYLKSGHIARARHDIFATFTPSNMFVFLAYTYEELIFRRL